MSPKITSQITAHHRLPRANFEGNLIYTDEKARWEHTSDYAPLVKRLAADPALCKTLADNAAHDIPVYTWAEIASQFEDFFNTLL